LRALSPKQDRRSRGRQAWSAKRSRRLFDAVGLITAFSRTNASQHELRFYRGLMEDPVVKLAAKVVVLTSLLASRLAGIKTNEAEGLTAPVDELTRR
jgi:hypothetical protein